MTSNERLRECSELIDAILTEKLTVERIDMMYDDMLAMYYSEMSLFLEEIKQTPRSKKVVRHAKLPYWDDELSQLWKEFHNSERAYLKSDRKSLEFSALKTTFLNKQKLFDKTFHKKGRSFKRRQVYQLEEINTTNPNEFWSYIKRMGPKRNSDIPWEVYDVTGNVVIDEAEVLNEWKNDSHGLLTPPNQDTPEQLAFKDFIKANNVERENTIDAEICNKSLNKDFTEEVRKVITKAK